MAIVINGSGTVTGLAVGGLPDGTVDAGTVAADVATQAEIDAKASLTGAAFTGNSSLTTSGDAIFELVGANAGNSQIRFSDAAGSDRGRIHYEHSNDSLQFKNNGATNLTIDSTGAVTIPNQPAFQAFGSVGNQDIDPSSSWNTIVLGTERFDNNADFSANTFTAPVTGKYQLNALVYLLNADSAASYSEIQIKTSNKVYQAILSTNQFNGDLNYLTLMASALADMDSNDTAYVQVNIGGGAAQTDVSAGTVFSGYLVC